MIMGFLAKHFGQLDHRIRHLVRPYDNINVSKYLAGGTVTDMDGEKNSTTTFDHRYW
jgi:hypothetical protein